MPMTKASDLERYMLELVNAERAAVGAPPLQLELTLNYAAAQHSLWMLETDMFQHAGAGNSTPRMRMENAGFDFGTASSTAENIAAQSERDAAGIQDDVYDLHVALMNSEGHRKNILNPALDYIGIGIETGDLIYDNGKEYYSVIVTQKFATTNGAVNPDIGEIIGTLNDDTLNGTTLDDTIRGLNGSDVILGVEGDDTLQGNDGSDRIEGGAGHDEVIGNRGHDLLNGASGNDLLNGGYGRDLMYGGAGDDTLLGGRDEDTLVAGNGDDSLRAGPGDDILNGGKGNDSLFGGSGADTFLFERGGDTDRIEDFRDDLDQIDLTGFGFTSISAALGMATQQGADVVFDFGLDDILIVENTQLSALSNDLLI